MILVKNNLQYTIKNLTPFAGGQIEIQGITVNLTTDKIDIINIYNPTGTLNKN